MWWLVGKRFAEVSPATCSLLSSFGDFNRRSLRLTLHEHRSLEDDCGDEYRMRRHNVCSTPRRRVDRVPNSRHDGQPINATRSVALSLSRTTTAAAAAAVSVAVPSSQQVGGDAAAATVIPYPARGCTTAGPVAAGSRRMDGWAGDSSKGDLCIASYCITRICSADVFAARKHRRTFPNQFATATVQ